MNKTVLSEKWHKAEYIDDDDGKYKIVKWRTVEQIGFYLKAFGKWFYPCQEDQERLKRLIMESNWDFGGKFEIELRRDFNEIDDNSWVTLEEHTATKEEKKRVTHWIDLDE